MLGVKTSDDFWEIIEELHHDFPDNQVAHSLFNHEVKRDNIDYLSLIKKDEEILLSYMPAKRAREALSEGRNPYIAEGRQTARIGKALNKILIYEYDNDHLKSFVENVQKYFMLNVYELIHVKPSDFKQYYLVDNYVPAANSELGKSCMRHERCQDRFGIYEDNPNLEMVVALRRGKVAARALVWKDVHIAKLEHFAKPHHMDELQNSLILEKFPSGDGLTLLDRVYACNPTAKQFVLDAMRSRCDIFHHTPKDAMRFATQDGTVYKNVAIFQNFDKYKYKSYPYIDTLKYFDIEGKRLINYTGLQCKGGVMQFNDQETGRFNRVNGATPHYEDIVAELDGKPLAVRPPEEQQMAETLQGLRTLQNQYRFRIR